MNELNRQERNVAKEICEYVVLSEAKDLAPLQTRFFASLRMTTDID
jgi:hypothetical protein